MIRLALTVALAEAPLVAFILWRAWHEPSLPPSVRAELEALRRPARRVRRIWGVLVIFGRQR